MSSEHVDVLIIGAGPAGSAAANYLARAGRDVLLVDRNETPADAVGESLLPACAPVLDELGIDMTGFKVKHGAVFAKDGRGVRFPFDEAMRNDWPLAWQTPRGTLDARMRSAAVEAGARFEVRDVTGIDLPVVQTSKGPIEADLVIDAAGRTQLLGRALGVRTTHPRLRNAAITAWFEGVTPQAPEQEGDIALCAFPGGWFWFIPFADGVWSVGAVTTPEGPKGRDRFEAALALCPDAASRLEGATRVRDFTGYHDISVSSTRFHGDGWVLLGDAATFIDPIFSTGVALGLNSARSLSSCLIDGGDLDRWEAECRAAVDAFWPMVDAFYDGSFMEVALAPPERQQATVRQAIISLLAADVFDPDFGAPRRFGKRFPTIHRMVTS